MKKRKKKNDVSFEEIGAIKEKALNYLFSTYYSDLCFIINFQKFREKKIGEKYYDKVDFSFKEFLKKYSVLRGIDKPKHRKIFNAVTSYLSNKPLAGENCESKVKGLVKCISKITGMENVSMASKILFLNEPDKILPIDNYVKRATGINNYSKYLIFIQKLKESNHEVISRFLKEYFVFMEKIETQAENMMGYKLSFNIVDMRINRFIDKLLWRYGYHRSQLNNSEKILIMET